MIDTIKISIHREVNNSIYNLLLYNSDNRKHGFILNNRQGIATKSEVFVFKSIEYENHETILINGSMKVSSHEYNIYYRAFDDRIDLEFSLPKFIYGTNVIELRSHYQRLKNSPYDLLIMGLKEFFNYFFPLNVVNWGGVEIKRWDFCYNQIFDTPGLALQCLKYQKLKVASKSDRLTYEYGLVQLSKSKYFKIYYKGIEFEKHDRLKYINSNIEKIQSIANCTLRYEKKITIKNLAYWYNTNYKFQYQPELKKIYLRAKNNNKVSRQMRRDFENVQRFTIGNSKILDCTKLEKMIFDLTYSIFRLEIKRKFSVGQMAVDPLRREVIQGTTNKTMKIKILSLIKVFKSLKRAYESGAISKSTYYRYVSFMEDKNMSETNISSNIFQCWDSKNYYKALLKKGVNIFQMSKNYNF